MTAEPISGCPHCPISKCEAAENPYDRWQVFCGACGSSSGTYKTCEEAIAGWNRRAPAGDEAGLRNVLLPWFETVAKPLDALGLMYSCLRVIRPYITQTPMHGSRTPLFKCGEFTSHSGLRLSDKIDCDALTAEDWMAHAKWFSDRIGFGKVVGIPSGGLKFAEALEEYCSPFGPVLIVDDVLTTGKSMEEARLEFPDAVGAVLFSRTADIPKWITPRFIETGPVPVHK